MIFVKNINQYDENKIYFCEPIKNNIMNNSSFIRILYSTPIIVLNGIYLNIQLNDPYIEKYYNKYKCTFQIATHRSLIEEIRKIELNLLKRANISGKQAQYNISEQLGNGYIKIFSDSCIKTTSMFLLKISGIWETDIEYGVTYKFAKITE